MNFHEHILDIEQILIPISDQMVRVEELIIKNLETEIPLLKELGQYILKSGGKRIRPALLIFSAALFGCIDEKINQAANVIEYIHTATLLHDDVVDHAETRRSKESARSIWGNEASVLVGDYLFTLSFKYLASFQNIKVIETLSSATTMMARGEILQLVRSFESITLEEYLNIVKHKTASLMGAAMKIGGIMGGANSDEQNSLYECGECLGIAFQMVDDTLDFSTKHKIGKDTGTDLKERKITLPLSHLIENANSEELKIVMTILDEIKITDKHVTIVKDLIHKNGSLEFTLAKAEEYIQKAIGYLERLPDNVYRKSIEHLAAFLVYRNM